MRSVFVLLLGLLLATSSALCRANGKLDPSKAYFRQVSAAAHRGDLKSQVCLGELYATGFGTARDYGKAFQWYKRAADRGFPEGVEAVAGAYQSGLSVPRNPKRALVMFHGLVDHGYMQAATDIGVYYMDNDWGVRKNYNTALEWYRKAAAADDYWAEIHIGMMYASGRGVKKDRAKAEQWLRKAADHKIDCMASFADFNAWIANANLHLPKNFKDSVGPFAVNYHYHDGRAENITIVHSSGSKEFDDAEVRALRASYFPPWPTDYHTDDKTLGFWIMRNPPDVSVGFGSELKAAIRAAMVIPLHVLIYGSKGTDISTVAFDYLNGKVSHIRVIKSSGDKYEDAAAIEAVNNAHYPETPVSYKNQKMHFSVPINFMPYRSKSSTASSHATPSAPSVSDLPTAPGVAKLTAAGVLAATSETNAKEGAPAQISDKSVPNVQEQVKQNANDKVIPIRILSTSWNDPNYIRPLRMEVGFENTSGEIIDSVTLHVSKCAVKGASISIPYPLRLRGSFKPDTSYNVKPAFPANYTEFMGYWPNIEGGEYSTHMLITEIDIDYAGGGKAMFGTDVSKLLGNGISNFCSTNYH